MKLVLDRLNIFIRDFRYTRDNARLTFSGKQLQTLCEDMETLISAYENEKEVVHKAELNFARKLKDLLCRHDEDYHETCISPSYLEAEIEQLLMEKE